MLSTIPQDIEWPKNVKAWLKYSIEASVDLTTKALLGFLMKQNLKQPQTQRLVN
jgi:hypothetical protein